LRKAHILIEEEIGRLVWFKLGSPEDEADEKVLASVKKKVNKHSVDIRKSKPSKAGRQPVLPIFE